MAGGRARLSPGSFLGHPHAQQTGGPEYKYSDEDAEDHDLRPFRADVGVAERGCQPDDHAADRGTRDVPDAAEHRGRERDQAAPESELVIDRVVVEAPDHSPGAGEKGADEER